MKIGILGTGMVGNSIGTKLTHLGHEVMMGSRTANNEKAAKWVGSTGKGASQGTFADAAKYGVVVFNCTGGMVTLEVMKLAGVENLKRKILVDVSNPLDFSKGMPPTLSVANDNSIGEEIQKLLPETKVVKTLNTLNCNLMVNPSALADGDHDIFLSGNDLDAKMKTKELLKTFGWNDENIVDLGDITTSRGTEQFLPLWIRLMTTLGTPMFQIKIVR